VRCRGFFQAALHDARDHSFEICPDILGWDAKSLDSLIMSTSVAALVARQIITEIVRRSVDLDRHAR
jgi:hypothetical protein